MKPSALFEALHALIGQRVPLHIWGACAPYSLTPADLRSLPRIAGDQAEWVPPKFLRLPDCGRSRRVCQNAAPLESYAHSAEGRLASGPKTCCCHEPRIWIVTA